MFSLVAPSRIHCMTSEDDKETLHHQSRKCVEIIRHMKDCEEYHAFSTARPWPIRWPSEATTPEPPTRGSSL